MSRQAASEPAPVMSAHQFISHKDHSNTSNASGPTQRRRRSSSLPGEPRGDTGAAALSTLTSPSPSNQRQDHLRATPESPTKPLPRRGQKGYKRRKAKSFFRRWKSLSVRHTWLNPLLLVLILLSAYFIRPSPQNPLHKAIFLSYPIPGTSPLEYGKGRNDFAFVAFYTIVLSFTREFLMQRVIRPFAISRGIRSRGKLSRFMEQAYTAMYFIVFGPFGLYVMYRSPVWYFNTDGMFEGFPHRQHEGLFKAYYLLQAAYWCQQFIVLALQLEKPRKDFKELVAHHIVTIALIALSYRFHFARMGIAVFVTHDISDFFLAFSKILNYLDSPITVPWFTAFILVWAYCRHYVNLVIIWATLTDFRTVGPFELNWETQQYKCWISQYITFVLLAAIQSLNIFWFVLILRIAGRIVFSNTVADERSEPDEGEEGEVEGSTAEKRERMGVAAVGAQGGLQTVDEAPSTPKVLLNGIPVDEASNGSAKGRSSGRRSVEVKAQERRKVAR